MYFTHFSLCIHLKCKDPCIYYASSTFCIEKKTKRIFFACSKLIRLINRRRHAKVFSLSSERRLVGRIRIRGMNDPPRKRFQSEPIVKKKVQSRRSSALPKCKTHSLNLWFWFWSTESSANWDFSAHFWRLSVISQKPYKYRSLKQIQVH